MLNAFRSEIRPLVVLTVVLTLITAVVYPLAVTGVAQLVFPRQATGSVITRDGVDVGSSLIGQSFADAAYFHGRPSAAGEGYDASASSGSNLGPTSQKLVDRVTADAEAFRTDNGLATDAGIPADAITTSASGLDPHVSPATAAAQVARVAKARGVDVAKVQAVLDGAIEQRVAGVIGEPRVNVLLVNLALDREFPRK